MKGILWLSALHIGKDKAQGFNHSVAAMPKYLDETKRNKTRQATDFEQGTELDNKGETYWFEYPY